MKLLKTILGAAIVAAIVPFKITSEKISDEENAPKKVSVESLTYRLDVTPEVNEGVTEKKVTVTVPADGIRRIVSFAKEKFVVVREKATVAKDKVVSTVNNIRDRRAAKKAAAAEGDVIEVPVEGEPAEA